MAILTPEFTNQENDDDIKIENQFESPYFKTNDEQDNSNIFRAENEERVTPSIDRKDEFTKR